MPISETENGRQKFHKFVETAIEYESRIDTTQLLLLRAALPTGLAPLNEGVRAKAMKTYGRIEV